MSFTNNSCNKLLELLPFDLDFDKQIKDNFFSKHKVYYLNPPLITHNNDLDSIRRIISKQPSKASNYWRNVKQNRVTLI